MVILDTAQKIVLQQLPNDKFYKPFHLPLCTTPPEK